MSALRRAAALAALLSAAAAVVAGTIFAGNRWAQPLPAAQVRVQVPAAFVPAPGAPPPVATPASGSLLLQDEAGDALAAARADQQRPIASLAKTMVALLVLRAHPLAPGDEGPELTLTAADVALYDAAIAAQGSAVAVRAGERLSERQLLLALLLPSANNIAGTLAVWVGGDEPSFVALENRTAAGLGMTRTHFDDASGVSQRTVSTARDLVRLARAALSVPALAALVATRSATLPDGTRLTNLDIALRADGDWAGIKTGWTPAAGGCLLFAARHVYAAGRPPVTVYGAVLGQPPDASSDPAHPELGLAFAGAEAAVRDAFAGFTAVDLATLPPPVVHGSAVEPWGAAVPLTARAATGIVVVRLGQRLALNVSVVAPVAVPEAGALVAELRGALGAGRSVSWPVVTGAAVAPPSLWWRLLRSPAGVGALGGAAQRGQDLLVLAGEVGRDAKAFDAVPGRHQLELVQPEVLARGCVAGECRQRIAPPLAQRAR